MRPIQAIQNDLSHYRYEHMTYDFSRLNEFSRREYKTWLNKKIHYFMNELSIARK